MRRQLPTILLRQLPRLTSVSDAPVGHAAAGQNPRRCASYMRELQSIVNRWHGETVQRTVCCAARGAGQSIDGASRVEHKSVYLAVTGSLRERSVQGSR